MKTSIKFRLWNLASAIHRLLPLSVGKKKQLKRITIQKLGIKMPPFPNSTHDYLNYIQSICANYSNLTTPELIRQVHGAYASRSFSSKPLVSIIIPVYNNIRETLICLLSISKIEDACPYEIIVADDFSQDETEKILGECLGIRYLRNTKNLGFLRTCNYASSYMSGEFIVLLNNDTIVLSNWLDSLASTFVTHKNVGLVGSKLLFPDGRLQEAGGFIWKDGTGWNFGRGDDPQRPKYNYLRDVDYCSGASIMLPKKIWDTLGGFDNFFEPAYYEDTDMAFRVKNAGYKVLYQPKSVVIHVEGLSSGTELTAGIKKFQQVNHQKFVDRWKDILNTHGITDDSIKQQKSFSRQSKGRILYVDNPDTTSKSDKAIDFPALLQKMRLFKELDFEVSFISSVNIFPNSQADEMQNIGIECLYSPYITSVDDYLKNESGQFSFVFFSHSPTEVDYINLLKRYDPQVQIVSNLTHHT
ncbi:MAG: glycosyltransferase family 2 protein [Nitrosomonas sp. PRO4]|nr:glycosyltransferase family 2 protein [Nitrosomonas sp. PRO4]MCK6569148.1 glycosyltransferase family 2 protein [Anaerolineales bacterium]RIK52455.1 MAG: hypothetical protein DCC59_10165 [Chloroflexota bacterium]